MTFTLTALEEKVMRAIPEECFYEQGFDSILWMDIFLDCIADVSTKQSRMVIVNLKKKGLIDFQAAHGSGSGEGSTLWLLDAGKQWLKERGLVDDEGYPLRQQPEAREEQEEAAEEVQPEGEVEEEEIVTAKSLAGELGITDKSLRRKLRKEGITRPGGRWEWTRTEADALIAQLND